MDSDKKTEARRNADKKWIENNREHASYLRSRSSAKSFIRNKATLKDIEELENLIAERKKTL